MTEGIGVYLQQRWAEFLMIFATSAFIPIELRHIWHRPSLASVLILLANGFIVWFLYSVLRREKTQAASPSAARTGGDPLGGQNRADTELAERGRRLFHGQAHHVRERTPNLENDVRPGILGGVGSRFVERIDRGQIAADPGLAQPPEPDLRDLAEHLCPRPGQVTHKN